MLFSYNADILPRLRMTGHIRYSQPWIHFARRLDEYVLYVIREGNMYLRENELEYHLKAGDFFLLEPGFQHVGTRKASCDYFYAHFTHPELCRADDEAAAMAELAEKRRQSLISYNLDAADPTDSLTYLPKHFHLPGGEHRSLLRSAVACYEAREEHYKRRPPPSCTASCSRPRTNTSWPRWPCATAASTAPRPQSTSWCST